MWLLLLIISSLTSILSIFLMFKVSKKGGINASSFSIIMPFVLGGFSLFIFLDSLSFVFLKESFIYSFFFNNLISEILILSVVLITVGMAIDFVGIYLMNLWEYPPVSRNKKWYLVYAPMWVIFGFCMQLFWVLISSFNLEFWFNLFFVTLIGTLSLELINIYGSAWFYKGMFKKPVVLFLGWFVLTLTCVILPVLFVVNPLGLIF